MSFLMSVILLGVSAMSVRRRVRDRVRVFEEDKGAAETPRIESPASRAIIELVGLAGGIYVAITALMSFLQIHVPEQISFFGVKVGPVALLALLVAIAQPFFVRRR